MRSANAPYVICYPPKLEPTSTNLIRGLEFDEGPVVVLVLGLEELDSVVGPASALPRGLPRLHHQLVLQFESPVRRDGRVVQAKFLFSILLEMQKKN